MANSAAALRLQSDLKAISQSPPEGCASLPDLGPTESFWANSGYCTTAARALVWLVVCQVALVHCAGAALVRPATRTCLCGVQRCSAQTKASGRVAYSACGALQQLLALWRGR